MSLGWMLVVGLVLLLVLGAYFVLHTSNQVGDYSMPPLQNYDLSGDRYGGRAQVGARSIDVMSSSRSRVPHDVSTEVATWKSQTQAAVTAASPEPDSPAKAIRQIFVNGEKVFDGDGVSKVTIRISNRRASGGPSPSALVSVGAEVPTRGLIIIREPLEKILNGTKTMELRKKSNKTRGPIALIQKGSGNIVGVATIGDCVGPMSFSDFTARAHEHGVESHRLRQVFDDGYVVGWKLSGVKRLRAPVPYFHKPGAVTWVTLGDSDRAALNNAMGT